MHKKKRIEIGMKVRRTGLNQAPEYHGNGIVRCITQGEVYIVKDVNYIGNNIWLEGFRNAYDLSRFQIVEGSHMPEWF